MSANDTVWQQIRAEAQAAAKREPTLMRLLDEVVLARGSLEEALSFRLARKLGHHAMPEEQLREVFYKCFKADPQIIRQVEADILAVCERDPACRELLTPVLYFKGFQSMTAYRLAHHLWTQGRTDFALYLQSLVAEIFGVDIHPAAKIGSGILLDHATGIVVGETTVIADNVSILQGVTLGGTGKDQGDRHPKIHSGVLIGAGSKILGNIIIGEGSKVGANSVVLHPVPPHATVAGVPARIVGRAAHSEPSRAMDHKIEGLEDYFNRGDGI